MMDEYEIDDADGWDMRQELLDDKQETKNYKILHVDEVAIRRVKKDNQEEMAPYDEFDSDDLSQHEFQYAIGKTTELDIVKMNLNLLIKLQSLVRGFLARKNKSKPVCLYNRILNRNSFLVRFLLIKLNENQYKLSAILRKQSKVTMLNRIPFSEAQVLTDPKIFKEYLIFAMQDGFITELDLSAGSNPFIEDVDYEHLFITDFVPSKGEGEQFIIQWQIKDSKNTYPVSLSYCVDQNNSYYKFSINHMGQMNYLKLHKLPEDIFYMAYYFNETVRVQLDDDNKMLYPYQVKMTNRYDFLARMRELEKATFGYIRTKTDRGSDSKFRNNDKMQGRQKSADNRSDFREIILKRDNK